MLFGHRMIASNGQCYRTDRWPGVGYALPVDPNPREDGDDGRHRDAADDDDHHAQAHA